MENPSDSFMPGSLLFCLKSGRSVCYSVPDNRQLKEENMEQADEMAACREEVEKGLRDLESARSAWR